MEELSILELQARMTSGETTARSLAEHYLGRTEQLDTRGPALNAVIETNPDALRIAAALDEERRTRGLEGRSTASQSCSRTTSTPPTR
jgi:amidase